MRGPLAWLILLLVLAPLVPAGAGAPSLEGGLEEAVVALSPPGFDAVVDLTVPAGFRALNATLRVTGMAAAGNATAFPQNVSVKLDGTEIWGFREPGCGPLGRQDGFLDGGREARFSFGDAGGTEGAVIRLPKGAVVKNATLDLEGSVPLRIREIFNFTGNTSAAISFLGFSVADAGDFNGDGFDDVLAGQTVDGALLYLGGRNMDTREDLFFVAYHPWLGTPAEGAGDFNGDGYDDIVVAHLFIHPSGSGTGRAYITYGGPGIDNDPDVNIYSSTGDYDYTTSVSGAGDVNGDGYDDVTWGSIEEYTDIPGAGRAYIIYGGPDVSKYSSADMAFSEGQVGDWFGEFVSGAGDVNGDGYDDILVSARRNDSAGNDSGRAYLYFGGPAMDNQVDVTFAEGAAGDEFGVVSEAGDLNGDGYDDVLVGAPYNGTGGDWAGAAYIYFGGRNMDNVADLTLTGTIEGYRLGNSSAPAGDLNGDGYDDIAIGTWGTDGKVYIFFGGESLDNAPDVTLTGEWGDRFGYAVSGGGDVNADGYPDVLVGSYGHTSGGKSTGQVSVHSLARPIPSAALTAGRTKVWERPEGFLGASASGDFSAALNGYLASAAVCATDEFGNGYVDVTLDFTAGGEGNITVSNLSIIYEYEATTTDFAGDLNDYLVAHQDEMDGSGNISVPISIKAGSEGRLRISGLDIARDMPPVLTGPIPDREMDEDTGRPELVDLQGYFVDDADAVTALAFSVATVTGPPSVTVSIAENRYVAVAASANWTGTVKVAVACTDRWGQTTRSNEFFVVVGNVDDSPVITSSPLLLAEPGVPYRYNVTASDGDGDALRFRLARAPSGMTIDPDRGSIEWLPRARGSFEISIAVHDGNASDGQDFTLTVSNRPPAITSIPPLNATVGVPCDYTLRTEDPNLDSLTFLFDKAPPGMVLGAGTGSISWTPAAPGDFEVAVRVSDGLEAAFQNFTIHATWPNRPPVIVSAAGPDDVRVRSQGALTFSVEATDPDGDSLTYDWQEDGISLGTGRTLSHSFPAGKHTLVLLIGDGHHRTSRTFDFVVDPAPAPSGPALMQGAGLAYGIAGVAMMSVVAAGAIWAGGTEVGKYRFLALLVPLYTRFHGDETLDNETRGMIRGCILSQPGIHLNELRRRLGLGNGSAVHHLHTLEREGIIQSRSDGRLRRFYPAGMTLVDMPLNLNFIQKGIFKVLREKDGQSQKEIAQALDVNSSTANRQVRKMADMGVLRLERHGMTVKCFVNEEWRARLDRELEERPVGASGVEAGSITMR